MSPPEASIGDEGPSAIKYCLGLEVHLIEERKFSHCTPGHFVRGSTKFVSKDHGHKVTVPLPFHLLSVWKENCASHICFRVIFEPLLSPK